MRIEKCSLIRSLCAGALLVPSAAMAASGETNASVEAFMSSTYSLVSTDVSFRFSELVPADGTNSSTHILIEGLVPLTGNTWTSSYTGIDSSDGSEHDVGQVFLDMPDGTASSTSGPIVGIAPRTGGWAGYTNTEPTTALGGASGTVDYDTDAGTMDFSLTKGGSTFTGMANFTLTDASTADIDPFSLTDGTTTLDFEAAQLALVNDEFYGVIVSGAEVPDYDATMFALRLDGDLTGSSNTWGGYPIVINPDLSTWADATSDWMGYLNLDNLPYLFSWELNVFLYMSEPASDARGQWIYFYKRKGDSHTIVAEGANEWGGYNIVTNPDNSRWADTTDNWMGYINIDRDPYLYSWEGKVWAYFSEPASDANGAWAYVYRRRI